MQLKLKVGDRVWLKDYLEEGVVEAIYPGKVDSCQSARIVRSSGKIALLDVIPGSYQLIRKLSPKIPLVPGDRVITTQRDGEVGTVCDFRLFKGHRQAKVVFEVGEEKWIGVDYLTRETIPDCYE